MKIEVAKTALLTLDVQKGIVANLPNSDSILPNAAKAVDFARKSHIRIIHVGLGFSKGHPEISDAHPRFSRLKQMNGFLIGTEMAEFHSSIFEPDDLIVYKHRVGGFSENHLHLVLRSLGIQNLVLFGIATSGIVLSTLRRASDLDFSCTVLKDACFDTDPEVHRVLTEKVFAAQASVLTVNDFATSSEVF